MIFVEEGTLTFQFRCRGKDVDPLEVTYNVMVCVRGTAFQKIQCLKIQCLKMKLTWRHKNNKNTRSVSIA